MLSRSKNGSVRLRASALRRSRLWRLAPLFLVEQVGELLHHGAPELVDIDDRYGPAVVAGHVVADADGDDLDGRARLDVFDDVAQVAPQVVSGIDRDRKSTRLNSSH